MSALDHVRFREIPLYIQVLSLQKRCCFSNELILLLGKCFSCNHQSFESFLTSTHDNLSWNWIRPNNVVLTSCDCWGVTFEWKIIAWFNDYQHIQQERLLAWRHLHTLGYFELFFVLLVARCVELNPKHRHRHYTDLRSPDIYYVKHSMRIIMFVMFLNLSSSRFKRQRQRPFNANALSTNQILLQLQNERQITFY